MHMIVVIQDKNGRKHIMILWGKNFCKFAVLLYDKRLPTNRLRYASWQLPTQAKVH